MEELIRVQQLPIIVSEERLREMKSEVDKRVAEAVALVCTEETIKSVKETRATLRKELEELENQRKAVKSAVFSPYTAFEDVYRECISDGYRMADAALKCKIDDVENAIKQRCEDGLREYFDELCVAHGLDWLEYEQAGITVDMASARQKTPNKLRKQLLDFVVRVSKSIEVISNFGEYAEEILVEFKNNLDAPESIKIVQERHRRIEAERETLDARAEQVSAETASVRRVEALARPVVQEPQEMLTVTFTVTDSKDRLVALREWMKENGYKYE